MSDTEYVDYRLYDVLYNSITPWPCLSFDFLYEDNANKTEVGKDKKKEAITYPISVSCVAGTQSIEKKLNCIYVLRWDNLDKLNYSSYSDEDEDSDSSNESDKKKNVSEKTGNKKNTVRCQSIKHPYGNINRIKVCKQKNDLIALNCEDKGIYLYNIKNELKNIKELESINEYTYNETSQNKPLYVFKKHTEEGFSLDWNPIHLGMLLTGDNDGNLFLWNPKNNDSWEHTSINVNEDMGTSTEICKNNNLNNNTTYQRNGKSNIKYSVEDIEWNKTGNGLGNIFAMCSSDKSIKIIDIRNLKNQVVTNSNNNNSNTNNSNTNNSNTNNGTVITINNAHSSDVNVISWNSNGEYLLASGGDDGLVKIWDIRSASTHVAELNFHKKAISSISWNPNDTYVILAASLDNTVSIWDLSVESESLEFSLSEYPDQLLFEHYNPGMMTETKFHSTHPGLIVSTSSESFNIFKPSNI
ncbi:ribosome assembly protein RRB1, putative [Hepatocystis sp. ex Piliocolobus tephrosceles]|nr:ribosome assembly protein RRB1, putative [Hepatocystis sp. ex Piliocolobus tephrosceles]